MSDGIVDSHVHVWNAARIHYPWLTEVPQLEERYDLADVTAEQQALGVTDVVLVQAADDVNETEFMLEVARSDPRVAGVVGWVPLLDPSAAEVCLDRWSGQGVVGVRHLVHRDPDPELLTRPPVDDVLSILSDRGLTFDVCAETLGLLGLVPRLAERHPDLTFVVDHLAKPPIADRGWDPWARLLAEAAAAPNVVAKVSGLNTCAEPDAIAADYQPYIDHAVEVFGPDRLLFGGDWPFALLASDSYGAIVQPLLTCLNGLDAVSRSLVLSGTARRIYGLSV